jgi:hypothetical protein
MGFSTTFSLGLSEIDCVVVVRRVLSEAFFELAYIGEKSGRLTRQGGQCSGSARHRPKHAATRLPPAGPSKAHAEVLCFRSRRRDSGSKMNQRRRETTANDTNSQKEHRRDG